MKNIKNKILLIFSAIIAITMIIIYCIIIKHKIVENTFAKDSEILYQNNKEQVFKVDNIVICSSANAIDKSEDQKMRDLSIYQYTDIAVQIENGEELTDKNTVKKLYIDGILLEGNENLGQKSLTYKNTIKFGDNKEKITEPKETENIDFNIVYTNKQNEEANYDEPTFFTDCSNPITLEYLNYDIKTNYKLEEDSDVGFDGNLLEKAGILPKDIACKVKFRINIINNLDEKYSCPINFEIPFKDIYSGTAMGKKNTINKKYIFFRES